MEAPICLDDLLLWELPAVLRECSRHSSLRSACCKQMVACQMKVTWVSQGYSLGHSSRPICGWVEFRECTPAWLGFSPCVSMPSWNQSKQRISKFVTAKKNTVQVAACTRFAMTPRSVRGAALKSPRATSPGTLAILRVRMSHSS